MLNRVRQQSHDVLRIARRDWLDVGRIPAALCAAAVCLAARANHLQYSIEALALHLHVAQRYHFC
jgi:transcription initiation factor TFIIIB Brf1 subunit/transcription initiation factor TFIIB